MSLGDFETMRARGLKVLDNAKRRPAPVQEEKPRETSTRQDWIYGPHTMPGQLCSKSNSRRIVRMGNRIASIKSAESLAYCNAFSRLMPRAAQTFAGPVRFEVDVYYKDRRRDLDVALLQDCLQAHGILLNDRQVVEIHARRHIDKDNPRSVFMVSAVNPSAGLA